MKAVNLDAVNLNPQWLSYWAIYGCLCTFESLLGGLILWLPLYYEAKFCFLIWLQAPQFKGSVLIFDSAMKATFGSQKARSLKNTPMKSASHRDSEVLNKATEFLQVHSPEMYHALSKESKSSAPRLY
eukprot:CAMPEP_0196591596 /NCGR_PEP_ID=MMETSP1081-20130531/70223_1 /TAXON_ID=36882 /ORGANISM="Pyramimonas amylifera, Strain CCMP720" /LENGTH=127 /DNA_ID=CAMNT_0041915001 /DNA_START=204 /DNA_END=587 /DNA_ORIENTATION=-